MSLFVSSDMSVLSVHEDDYARSGASKSFARPSFSAEVARHTQHNAPMHAEEPITRLVSRQEYVAITVGKGHLYAMAVAVGCLGVAIIAYALYTLAHDTFASHGQVNTLLFLASEAIFLGAIGATAIWYARMTFVSAKKLETISPITNNNSVGAADFETLVRAYAFDPTQQNAELLRAALDSQVTPGKELLRATPTDLRN